MNTRKFLDEVKSKDLVNDKIKFAIANLEFLKINAKQHHERTVTIIEELKKTMRFDIEDRKMYIFPKNTPSGDDDIFVSIDSASLTKKEINDFINPGFIKSVTRGFRQIVARPTPDMSTNVMDFMAKSISFNTNVYYRTSSEFDKILDEKGTQYKKTGKIHVFGWDSHDDDGQMRLIIIDEPKKKAIVFDTFLNKTVQITPFLRFNIQNEEYYGKTQRINEYFKDFTWVNALGDNTIESYDKNSANCVVHCIYVVQVCCTIKYGDDIHLRIYDLYKTTNNESVKNTYNTALNNYKTTIQEISASKNSSAPNNVYEFLKKAIEWNKYLHADGKDYTPFATFDSVTITQNDLDDINNNNLLDDNVLDFSSKLATAFNSETHYITSSEFQAALINNELTLEDNKINIIGWNPNGGHWCLIIAYTRNNVKHALLFDSMASQENTKKTPNKLFSGYTWVNITPISIQKDGNNCGVFCVAVAEFCTQMKSGGDVLEIVQDRISRTIWSEDYLNTKRSEITKNIKLVADLTHENKTPEEIKKFFAPHEIPPTPSPVYIEKLKPDENPNVGKIPMRNSPSPTSSFPIPLHNNQEQPIQDNRTSLPKNTGKSMQIPEKPPTDNSSFLEQNQKSVNNLIQKQETRKETHSTASKTPEEIEEFLKPRVVPIPDRISLTVKNQNQQNPTKSPPAQTAPLEKQGISSPETHTSQFPPIDNKLVEKRSKEHEVTEKHEAMSKEEISVEDVKVLSISSLGKDTPVEAVHTNTPATVPIPTATGQSPAIPTAARQISTPVQNLISQTPNKDSERQRPKRTMQPALDTQQTTEQERLRKDAQQTRNASRQQLIINRRNNPSEKNTFEVYKLELLNWMDGLPGITIFDENNPDVDATTDDDIITGKIRIENRLKNYNDCENRIFKEKKKIVEKILLTLEVRALDVTEHYKFPLANRDITETTIDLVVDGLINYIAAMIAENRRTRMQCEAVNKFCIYQLDRIGQIWNKHVPETYKKDGTSMYIIANEVNSLIEEMKKKLVSSQNSSTPNTPPIKTTITSPTPPQAPKPVKNIPEMTCNIGAHNYF